jgi:hypothetical protein
MNVGEHFYVLPMFVEGMSSGLEAKVIARFVTWEDVEVLPYVEVSGISFLIEH